MVLFHPHALLMQFRLGEIHCYTGGEAVHFLFEIAVASGAGREWMWDTEQESPGGTVGWVTTTVTPQLQFLYSTRVSAWQNQHLQFLFLLAWMYLKGSWRHPAVLRWKYLWTDNKDLRPQQRGECQLYKSISESSSKTAFLSCGI